MSDKINILFLVEKFDIGGIQKANINMINRIDKEKFNVHVLYIKDGVLKEEINHEEIKITKLGDNLELYSLDNIKYIFYIIKYIKQNNIKVIHTIDSVLYMIGATAAHFTKIIHIRSQPNFIRKYEKLNTKTLKILPFERWTHKYITFNESTKKDLNLAGVAMDKISVIYSYVNIDESTYLDNYENIREKIGVYNDTKIVCSIGRLVEKKGLETFIKMVPYVIKEYDNVIFLVIGDGPLREKLMQMCLELKIEKYVYFLGFRTDIPSIVKQVTMGVYATSESAGMIDIIRGCKVLISRESDLMKEYIIDGETGLLAKSDHPKEYAKCVIKLLKDEELLKNMEINTGKLYRERFEGDKNMKIFEKLVTDLIKNNIN